MHRDAAGSSVNTIWNYARKYCLLLTDDRVSRTPELTDYQILQNGKKSITA